MVINIRPDSDVVINIRSDGEVVINIRSDGDVIINSIKETEQAEQNRDRQIFSFS